MTRNSIKIATVSYGVRNIVTLVEVGGKRLKRVLQRLFWTLDQNFGPGTEGFL